MEGVLVPGVGSGAIILNWLGRVPAVVEGWVVVGVDVCAERIIDGWVVGKALSNHMVCLELLVLNWGLIGRGGSPWGLTLDWHILRIWIAGAGIGEWVHIGYSDFERALMPRMVRQRSGDVQGA